VTTTPNRFMAEYHEPDRGKSCVCGSGKKFKRCCAGSYSAEAAALFKETFNTGDYKNALVHARRHFTWYALSHKAHTLSLIEAKQDGAEEWLQLDIEALSELLENLHLCYYHLGISDEFLDVIDSVRNVIQDKRWDAKIAYARALWYLVDKHDENSAYVALQSIDIKLSKDPEILSLYLHVCPTRFTLSESVEILDRIIINTIKESVRLEYRVFKAHEYYLASQKQDGEKLFDEAISEFAELSDEEKSSYGRLQFATALASYGMLANRQDVLEDGRDAINGLIQEGEKENYKASYIAELHKMLGDCEEGLGNYDNAIKAYSVSLELNQSHFTKIFLSRSLCNNEDYNNARELLESIDEATFENPEKFDLAISWALLAAATLVETDIEEAKGRLKIIKAHDPMLIQLRDKWLIELLEAKPESEPGKIRKLISSLNKYVTMNPNFFGVGINVNRIIDDVDSVNKNKDKK